MGDFIPELIANYQKGGFFMHFIALTFGLSIAIVLERYFRLFNQFAVHGASFWHEIENLVRANDLDRALRLCEGASRAALPRVIRAGLYRASRDDQQIQNAIDAASLEVIPKLEKRLNYLALIANIATLLGLLGTITGLIHTFAAIDTVEATERTKLLSRGISEAMNCTAFGLLTAVFTMVAHSFLSSKATSLVEEVDEYGVKLLDLLSARRQKHTAEKV